VTHDTEQNTSSPSTTTAWKWAKIERPPERPRTAAPKAPPPLSRKHLRQTIVVEVRFRGGPELWWELRARGRVWRRPGSLAMHDVLEELYEGINGRTK